MLNAWSEARRETGRDAAITGARRASRKRITSALGQRTQRPKATRTGKPGSSTILNAVDRLTRQWNWMSRMSQYSGDLRSMTASSSQVLTPRRCPAAPVTTQRREPNRLAMWPRTGRGPRVARWLTLGVVVQASDPPETACRVFGLGDDIEVRAELHGGVNRVWRVRTERGDHAVHQLLGLPDDLDVLGRCAWVASLELAAIHAGVRAPAPVLVPGSMSAAAMLPGSTGAFIVHEWYDAPSVASGDASSGFAESLGDALARIHGGCQMVCVNGGSPI